MAVPPEAVVKAADPSFLSQGPVIALVVGLTLKTFYDIIIFIIDKFTNGKNESKTKTACEGCKKEVQETRALLHEVAEDLEKLVELHELKDQDGVPVWYITSSMRQGMVNSEKILSEVKSMLDIFHRDFEEFVKTFNKEMPRYIDNAELTYKSINILNKILEGHQ